MKSIFSDISRQLKTVTIIVVVLGIMLVGCKNNDFLTEHDWIHYDSACDEIISFGTDGHFAYYTMDGSPVGDSDLYDQYSYNSNSKKIILNLRVIYRFRCCAMKSLDFFWISMEI